MNKLNAGDVAYVDSFRGLVPCTAVAVSDHSVILSLGGELRAVPRANVRRRRGRFMVHSLAS